MYDKVMIILKNKVDEYPRVTSLLFIIWPNIMGTCYWNLCILNFLIIYQYLLKIHARYPWIKIYQVDVKNSCFLEINRIKKERNAVLLLGGGGSLNFSHMVHIAASIFIFLIWKVLPEV